MKTDRLVMMKAVLRLFLAGIALASVLTGCGGGGSGGGGGSNTFGLNGGPVAGSVSTASATSMVSTYTFNVVAGTAYTVSMVTNSGALSLAVFNGDPNTGTLIGTSFNSVFSSSNLDNVSFIANFTGPVSIQVADMAAGTSTYTIQAFTGDLAMGATKTASTYNSSIYYSFDAVANTAYQVQLTPQSGNVNISSVNANQTASVGSSSLPGTSMDTVTFLAPASQRYYVTVSPTSADSKFNITVNTASTEPDLRVAVNSATSDTANITINYTVYNQGLTAAGAFNVDLWSNATTAPAVGATGQTSIAVASLAAGASMNGSVTIPNTGASGTAYAIVDTANAVAESSETNNVSSGVVWYKPLAAPQSFDFENGLVPTGMTMSGDAQWAVDATTGSASTHSLTAGTISSGQRSCVAFSATNAASISFDYAVSSTYYYDSLNFYIDGTLSYPYGASGTVAWTNTGPISVSSGTHEYKWCYQKTSYSPSGSDTAWIDNIVVTQATVDLQVVVNSVTSDGKNATINYTATNNGNSTAGAFNVDLWSDAASAPAVGATGQTSVPYSSLGAGQSVTGSVTIPNTSASGTAYAIVDTANAVAETNETNNVSPGLPWVSSVDLQVAITSATPNGTGVTVNYTVTNTGTSAVTAFNVDLWSNSATAPTVGQTGQTTATIASLAAGQSTSGSVTIADASASGTAYAIADTLNAVGESNETNNVSLGVPWTAPPTVAAPVSYNFETGVVPPVMVMSGNASWAISSTTSGGSNKFSLKAGTITNSQTSCVAVYATGSSSISFTYSVSSELGWDFLNFYIDGTLYQNWSGTVAWTTSGTISAGTTGSHEYQWCYTKDPTNSSGSDTAWIDNIIIN